MVRVGGKAGYMNKKGEIVIEPQYSRADSFEHGLAFTQRGTPGKMFVFKDGTTRSTPDIGVRAWIDKAGHVVPREEASKILKRANDGYYEGLKAVRQVRAPYPYGFIDLKGRQVIPFKFEKVHKFSDGLAAAQSNGVWGFIDKTGKWVIPPQYENVDSFSEGLACVLLMDPNKDKSSASLNIQKMMDSQFQQMESAKETFK